MVQAGHTACSVQYCAKHALTWSNPCKPLPFHTAPMRLWLLGPSDMVEEPFGVGRKAVSHCISSPRDRSLDTHLLSQLPVPPVLPPGFHMGFSASCPSMSVQNKMSF